MKHKSALFGNYILHNTTHIHEVSLVTLSLDSAVHDVNKGTERFLANVIPIIIFHKVYALVFIDRWKDPTPVK